MSRVGLSSGLLLCATLALGPGAGWALPNPVHHVHKRESKEQIEDLEQQWRSAILTGDVGLMDSLLSDDYVGISMSGQINTKQMQLDRLRNRTLKIVTMDLTDVKVKLVGSVAVVTSSAQITGTNDGVDMQGTFRYMRVYQRLPTGNWKITNFEATRVPPGGRLRQQALLPASPAGER